MANRQQLPDQQQKGSKPMQTSPDDDEAQVEDQTHAADVADTGATPDQKKRRARPDQEEELEASAEEESEDDEAEDEDDEDADADADDEDDDDTISPAS